MKYLKDFEGLFDFFKRSEKDPRKIEIKKICKLYKINNYTINSDYSIDVDGDVIISSKNLVEIPLRFNRVEGCFDCSFNSLINLNNSPSYVGGNFLCQNQYFDRLHSLEGAPEYVGGRFNCSSNINLKSLEFLPNVKSLEIEFTSISSFDNISSNIEYLRFHGTPLNMLCKAFSSSDDIYNFIDLFKDFDPVHPPLRRMGKSILYFNQRYIPFLKEVKKISIYRTFEAINRGLSDDEIFKEYRLSTEKNIRIVGSIRTLYEEIKKYYEII